MKIKAYTINAFAKIESGGNPAGVVLDADHLSEAMMRAIAQKIGFSETAFVMASKKADFRVRFFTPNEEVDLCGHATIATFSVLLQNKHIKPGSYTQETKAGVLDVKVHDNEMIMMSQTSPSFYEKIDYQEVAKTLGISVNDFDTRLPCQIVSTGLKDLIIPIKTIKILDSIQPDFKKVSDLCRTYNIIGYHMFVLDSVNDSDAYCRNLAPLYGIDEESATGTSSGALASYLLKHKIIDAHHCHNIIFEQGYCMNMPSEIVVQLDLKDNNSCTVNVGGRGLNKSLMEIEVEEHN